MKPLDHVEQPDARTCQSAAIARIIGTQDVLSIRKELDRLAIARGSEAGDPHVMGDLLRAKFGSRYDFSANASINQLRFALDRGCHAITHGWFTPVGHIIGISGYSEKNGKLVFRAEDPWFEFDFPSGKFTNRTGDDAQYSAHGIYAYCVSSWSYEGAREIYVRGELLSSKGGMWLHMVQF